MMEKSIQNKTASVKARLLNLAKNQHIDFDSFLLRYMQERFLYRLSLSKYADQFILKGGLLLLCLDMPHTRPTIDIDFLAQRIKNKTDELKRVFKEILHIESDDGILFESNSVQAEEIKEGAEYQGVRLKIKGGLGKAYKVLQIDIGFGDVITPHAMDMDFPTILDDQSPKIKAYSIESVIAEKFEAMVKLSVVNSRMKDFYDVYSLLVEGNFSKEILKEAIVSTFKRRETILSSDTAIFHEEFYEDADRGRQWKAYLRKLREKDMNENFSEIMKSIIGILSPIVASIKE